jgi:hypothetical protein
VFNDNSSILSTLRLVRILRVLRLVRSFPELQIIIEALITGLKSIGYIGELIFTLLESFHCFPLTRQCRRFAPHRDLHLWNPWHNAIWTERSVSFWFSSHVNLDLVQDKHIGRVSLLNPPTTLCIQILTRSFILLSRWSDIMYM